jgi:hypothetical protein
MDFSTGTSQNQARTVHSDGLFSCDGRILGRITRRYHLPGVAIWL